MNMLLQIDQAISVAEKITPTSAFVYGAFAIMGYVIAYLVWKRLDRKETEHAQLIENVIAVITKTEIHLDQYSDMKNELSKISVNIDKSLDILKEINQK